MQPSLRRLRLGSDSALKSTSTQSVRLVRQSSGAQSTDSLGSARGSGAYKADLDDVQEQAESVSSTPRTSMAEADLALAAAAGAGASSGSSEPITGGGSGSSSGGGSGKKKSRVSVVLEKNNVTLI